MAVQMSNGNGGTMDVLAVLRALGRAIGALADGQRRIDLMILDVSERLEELERRVLALERNGRE